VGRANGDVSTSLEARSSVVQLVIGAILRTACMYLVRTKQANVNRKPSAAGLMSGHVCCDNEILALEADLMQSSCTAR